MRLVFAAIAALIAVGSNSGMSLMRSVFAAIAALIAVGSNSSVVMMAIWLPLMASSDPAAIRPSATPVTSRSPTLTSPVAFVPSATVMPGVMPTAPTN